MTLQNSPLAAGISFNGQNVSVAEALNQAELNYTVSAAPLYYAEPSLTDILTPGSMVAADDIIKALHLYNDKVMTVRDDDYHAFGIVGNRYGIVQPKDALGWVDLFCKGINNETPTQIERVISIDHGREIAIVAKFPQVTQVLGMDDIVEHYIVFSNTQDGTKGVKVMVTPIRVVCNNMINLALEKSIGHISWRHSSRIAARMDLFNNENVDKAVSAFNFTRRYKQTFEANMTSLAEKILTDQQIENIFVHSFLGEKNILAYEEGGISALTPRGADIINGMFNTLAYGVGQDVIREKNSAWAVLNAVTSKLNNEVEYTTPEQKYQSIVSGRGYAIVQKTYDSIMAA